MDVARIEAISPQQIDWRRLTAKDIIKYEQQGVDVPAQYLEWAREIKNSLDTDDDVTYEMASSLEVNQTLQVNNLIQARSSQGNSLEEDSKGKEEVISVTSDFSDNQEKTLTANEFLNKLRSDDVGLIEQGIIFRNISNANISKSEDSETLVKSIEASSNSEIDALESYMQDLLLQIQDVKSEIQSARGENKGFSKVGDISKLRQQLKSLGAGGQAILAAYGSIFNNYQPNISENIDSADITIDYGTVTEELASKIKSIPLALRFGSKIERAGSNAVSAGENLDSLATQALDTNTENLNQVSNYKADISSQTGVAAISDTSASNRDKNKPDDKEKMNSKMESEKEVKVSQNDGTDETAKMSTNIDEILKRKIRKGENINPA